MFPWLVQTKLQPPLPRSDVVPRPRLLEALDAALSTSRLTLLPTPAGYAKTLGHAPEELQSLMEMLIGE